MVGMMRKMILMQGPALGGHLQVSLAAQGLGQAGCPAHPHRCSLQQAPLQLLLELGLGWEAAEHSRRHCCSRIEGALGVQLVQQQLGQGGAMLQVPVVDQQGRLVQLQQEQGVQMTHHCLRYQQQQLGSRLKLLTCWGCLGLVCQQMIWVC